MSITVSITDLIAFTALLVAIYGAILSTIIAIKESLNLKLEVFNLKETYITLSETGSCFNEYGVHFKTYSKDLHTFFILVRITNKSKSPTTINEIILNNEYVFNSSSKVDNYVPTEFTYKNDNFISNNGIILNNYPIAKPLFEIDGLSSYEGYLVFNDVKEIPSTFDITINAVQKSKTYHLNISIPNNYCKK